MNQLQINDDSNNNSNNNSLKALALTFKREIFYILIQHR